MADNFLPKFKPAVTHGTKKTLQCLIRDRWDAKSVADRYQDDDGLGWLWMELRQQLPPGRPDRTLQHLDRRHPSRLSRGRRPSHISDPLEPLARLECLPALSV